MCKSKLHTVLQSMHPLASFDLGSSPRGARRNQRGHQEKWPVFWDRFILGIIISLPGHVVINGPPDEGDWVSWMVHEMMPSRR